VTEVVCAQHGGTIQALHSDGLVNWATKCECVLVLRHGVGDFVPVGEPLIALHGVAPSAEKELLGMVAFGVERTIEQGPGLRSSNHGGHRADGAFAGSQRTDDRHPGPRPLGGDVADDRNRGARAAVSAARRERQGSGS
jgi:hypothetical protein